jgi:hypothetical protein
VIHRLERLIAAAVKSGLAEVAFAFHPVFTPGGEMKVATLNRRGFIGFVQPS